ncbi:hypothetical protein [Dysgonomonas sp. 520]|uniref:hypothetical protein n=1 Tax=Dysgonomonas sp. 520 TaxID=2302931 RepID=UPI0013D24A5E|nr:hypothetical protein [Dysgonomonas sp. 520]NDW09599.1 hypothetical protein [Dysgonomonas sp. 520]
MKKYKNVCKNISSKGLAAIICLVAVSLLFTSCGLLSNDPRKPKNQIKMIREIGWCGNQNLLQIDSLEVKVLESNLNLFTSKSLVSYTVKGRLKNRTHPQVTKTKAYIDKVLVSEYIDTKYVSMNDSVGLSISGKEIRITPIVATKQMKEETEEESEFSFTNEYTVHSMNWGQNSIQFICGEKTAEIGLYQRK